VDRTQGLRLLDHAADILDRLQQSGRLAPADAGMVQALARLRAQIAGAGDTPAV